MKATNIKIVKLKNDRYQVQYTDPTTSKRIRKLFHFLDDAVIHKHQILHQWRYGQLQTGQRFIGHLLQVYLNKYPESRITERRWAFLTFCESFNHWEIDKLTPKVLKEWFRILKDKTGYTEKNMAIIKWLLNHFFKYLTHEEIIDFNPLEQINFSKRGPAKRAKVILTAQELKITLEQIKEFSPDLLYPFIYVIANTGARRDEVRKLKWGQIDFNTGYITFIGTKNGDNRMIQMSPPLRAYLQGLERGEDGQFLFLNEKGTMRGVFQIDYHIEAFQKAYPEQKKWRCHDLRHSYAYNFLKNGGEMYQLKAILGHRNISLTVDYYGHFKAIDIEKHSPYDF